MKPISQDLINAYKANFRENYARVTVDFLGSGVQKVYEGTDIIKLRYNASSEFTNNTSIPTGNVSYSVFNMTLTNRFRFFDVNNISSPIYGFPTTDSMIKVELGARINPTTIEYFDLFSGTTESFNANDNSNEVTVVAYDRLRALEKTDMGLTELQLAITAKDIFELILDDAGVPPANYNVDTVFDNSKYTIPVYAIQGLSHLGELRKLSEALSSSIYVEDDIIIVESIETLLQKVDTQEEYTISDYRDKTNKPIFDNLYNRVFTPYINFVPQALETVYETFVLDKEQIPVGTSDLSLSLNQTTCFDHTDTIPAVSGITIDNIDYYSNRAVLTITNTNPVVTEIVVKIEAKYYLEGAIRNTQQEDVDSQATYGLKEYTYPKNQYIQTEAMSQIITDNVLLNYREPFRDAEIQFSNAGNPALELTDKISIEDMYLAQKYNITQKDISFDGGLNVNFKAKKSFLNDAFLVDNLGNQFIDNNGNTFVTLTTDFVTTKDLTDNIGNFIVDNNGNNIVTGGF